MTTETNDAEIHDEEVEKEELEEGKDQQPLRTKRDKLCAT